MTTDMFYTPAEIMQILKISRGTFDKLIRAGALRYVVVGRQRRVFKDSLDAFITNVQGGIPVDVENVTATRGTTKP